MSIALLLIVALTAFASGAGGAMLGAAIAAGRITQLLEGDLADDRQANRDRTRAGRS